MRLDNISWPEGSVNPVSIWCLSVVGCYVIFLLIDVLKYLLKYPLRERLKIDKSEAALVESTGKKRIGQSSFPFINPSTVLCYTDSTDNSWAESSSLGFPLVDSVEEAWEFRSLPISATLMKNPDSSDCRLEPKKMSSRYCGSKRGSLAEESSSWPLTEDPGEIDLESALWSLGFGYGEMDPNLRIPSRFMQNSSVLDSNIIPSLSDSNSGCNCSCHPFEVINFTINDQTDHFDPSEADPMVNYTSNQSQLVVESILNEKNRQFLENFCRVSTTKLTEDRNKLLGEENPPVAEEFSSDPNTENDRRKLSTDYQLRKASRKLTRSSKIALDLLETPCGDKSNSFESEGISPRLLNVSDNVFLAPNSQVMGNSFNSESSGFADSESPIPKIEPQIDNEIIPDTADGSPNWSETNKDLKTPTDELWSTTNNTTVRRNPFFEANLTSFDSPNVRESLKQLKSRSHSTPSMPDFMHQSTFNQSDNLDTIFFEPMNKYQEILADCSEKIEQCNFESQFKQLQPLLPLGSRFNLETVFVTRLDVIEELRKLRGMVKLRTEKGLDTYELESNDKDDKLSGSAGQSVCKCDSVAKEMADLRNLILQSQQALHIQIAEATQQVQTAIKSLRHDRN